ncbi:MAG: O-antigen ligase family protein [Acidobacteriota bacterium]
MKSELLKPYASGVLGKIIFFSLLLLLPLTAIPYGTAEAWWKAFFICAIFALTILWLIDGLLTQSWLSEGWGLVSPILTLALFSILQTLQFTKTNERPGGTTIPSWNTISADPFQTRFFVLQLLALMMAGVLLFRYLSSESRLRLLINVVIVVAVATAIFGILRQTTQHSLGFGLPLLKSGQGYAQFINKNHFALLIEMALGLTLGMVIGGGLKRQHLLIYIAALLPMWAALGLCGSRGGLIAMMTQVVTAVLVLGVVQQDRHVEVRSKAARLVRSWPIKFVLLVLLIGGVVFGTLWLGGDRLATTIEHSFDQLAEAPDQTREGASRNEIWRTTWRMFTANPLVGVGMGAYWAAVPAFHDASGRLTPQEAHNDYLELLASGGVVGLAIVAWFVVVVVRRTRRNLRSPDRFRRAACLGALIGITGVAVHSLLDFGLHLFVNAFVFTTLLVIATSKSRWAFQTAEETS